ncbi:MAG TPA: amidotransferase 1, exosortase A system-associated [Blastocatellia bacterium]|nr:amidotransferase 1, exosortase A system-associated [Blastocatellia bacterium]HMX28698.1 amidotransferase 1, exosortase A system-associated [Blastocatellia bacterium]HMZ17306.1 amidotransferase 1, exosortase A system-associated [Blastocatellia bacterium]HNG30182.1 amidotransferase 1, exosortase A system-associated [Blastocatellia bacterium]
MWRVCGLAGIYHYQNELQIDEAVLRRMTGVLAHRGPDDDGFYVVGRIGLGHRRLSIIDVAGGRQPIFNEDQSIAIVFNGEIYNYRELARLVESRGHRLRTRSDTETIVHLYEEFGDACVEQLRGMFAFALWDARQQKLLLARDRVGKKPLYFADLGGTLIFGSELKALLEHPRMSREIDPQAVADYFSYQFIPSPKTIFQQARKLPAGHCLIVTPDGTRQRQYWDIDFSQVETRSETEWRELLLQEFQETVAGRLMSEVPLGAFLSSGVDSSAVVAMMNRVSNQPVVTASVGFTEEKYSEAKDARRFAESLNTRHHERIVSPDAVRVIEKLAWHYDEPFADASAIPTFYVSQAAREFVTVALSGDGGDENFAGYRRYAFDAAENRVRALIPAALRQPLFGALAAAYPKADWLPQVLRAKATLRNLSLDPARAYFNSVYGAMANERDVLLGGDVQRSLAGYDPFDVFAEHYGRANTDDSLSRAQYADIKLYLADDILTKVDRASMAVSLEVRCPLLDHKLMELAARIPSTLKLRGGEGKYIFKQTVKPLLPPEVLTRRKQGFVVPLAEWLRGELREPAESALFDASANDDWLEPRAVAELWRQHQAGRRDFSRPLWTIFMFRLWQKTFARR